MVDETELPDEVVEVLVAGVDVCFSAHADDAVEVVDVDVDEDAEEAGENLGAHLLEVLGEGDPCKTHTKGATGRSHMPLNSQATNVLKAQVHYHPSDNPE